jgi:hypothetical protein
MCMTLVCEFCGHAPMMTFYPCPPVPHEHADATRSTPLSFPPLPVQDDDALDSRLGITDGWAACQECSALLVQARMERSLAGIPATFGSLAKSVQ